MSRPVGAAIVSAVFPAAFLATFLAATATHAGDTPEALQSPPLILDLAGCRDSSSQELRSIVATELRRTMSVVDAGDDARAAAAEAVTVVVRCPPGAASAHIVVDDPRAGTSATRTLSLEETAPVARAYLLGLAVVELVLASRAPPETKPARPSETPAAAATASRAPPTTGVAEAHPRPTVREDRSRLTGSVSALVFSQSPVLVGGGVRFQRRQGDRWGWLADVAFHHGLRSTALGDVSVDVASAAAAVYAEIGGPVTLWQAAAGVHLGAARLSGEPHASATTAAGKVQGPWAAPHVQLGMTVAPARHAAITLTVDGGWVVWPLVARIDGSNPVAVRGAWARLSLGAAYVF
jgi:hypothetical protein